MKHLIIACYLFSNSLLIAQNKNIFFTISSKKQATIESLNQIATQYKAHISPAIAINSKKSNRGTSNIYIARSNQASAQPLFDRLQEHPSVIDIAFEPVNDVLHTPNDPYADPVTSSANGQTPLHTHNFYEAWDTQKGDTNITIGVVDTGIWYEHEDIKSSIYYNYNDPIDGINNDKDLLFGDSLTDDHQGWDVGDWDNDPTSTTSSHGLRVAGIIGATSNNSLGISGLVPNTRILHVKASPDSNPNSLTAGYTGLVYAVNKGCKIINLSWGSTNDPGPIFRQLIQDLIEDHDVMIVAAAGNSRDDTWYYPASYPGVISVSSVRADSLKQNAAVYNHHIDFNAVGANSKTLNLGSTGSYVNEYGTSAAAPVISSALALLKAEFPSYSSEQIVQQLKVTAFKNDTVGTNTAYEYRLGKMLDMKSALEDSNLPGYKVTANNQPDTILIANYSIPVNFVFDITNVLTAGNSIDVQFKNLTPNFSIDTTISISLSKNQVSQVTIPVRFNQVNFGTDTSAFLITYSDNSAYHDYEVVTSIIQESQCISFGEEFGYFYTQPAPPIESASITLISLSPNTAYLISYQFEAQVYQEALTSDANGEITLQDLEQGVYSQLTISTNQCSFTHPEDFDLTPITSLTNKQEESIFPNPISNTLNISIKGIEKVSILNNQGLIVKEFVEPSSQIDISNLPIGNYIIIITSTSGINQFKISKI